MNLIKARYMHIEFLIENIGTRRSFVSFNKYVGYKYTHTHDQITSVIMLPSTLLS